jgi:hypothetical protein
MKPSEFEVFNPGRLAREFKLTWQGNDTQPSGIASLSALGFDQLSPFLARVKMLI